MLKWLYRWHNELTSSANEVPSATDIERAVARNQEQPVVATELAPFVASGRARGRGPGLPKAKGARGRGRGKR